MSIAELRQIARDRRRKGVKGARVRLPDNKAALFFLAPFVLGAVLLTGGSTARRSTFPDCLAHRLPSP
ncbi:hypothetical protein [Microbacterium amylolyticum]|uniref:Uncharacterized protein n=1 Tax=Microbacterium amylolyticum TaxID=936337 RepID=A0ABS4ZIT2_9MICO|nr:hypothetical protein [Microbacterium amylolyticum]MBP2437181.1 hypothetical protein [Microbacterium amylolyticum]